MYLAQDRSDIGYAVKEVSRGMPAPTEGDLNNTKKLCRYLIGKEKCFYIIIIKMQGGGFTFGRSRIMRVVLGLGSQQLEVCV